eukprot:403352957
MDRSKRDKVNLQNNQIKINSKLEELLKDLKTQPTAQNIELEEQQLSNQTQVLLSRTVNDNEFDQMEGQILKLDDLNTNHRNNLDLIPSLSSDRTDHNIQEDEQHQLSTQTRSINGHGSSHSQRSFNFNQEYKILQDKNSNKIQANVVKSTKRHNQALMDSGKIINSDIQQVYSAQLHQKDTLKAQNGIGLDNYGISQDPLTLSDLNHVKSISSDSPTKKYLSTYLEGLNLNNNLQNQSTIKRDKHQYSRNLLQINTKSNYEPDPDIYSKAHTRVTTLNNSIVKVRQKLMIKRERIQPDYKFTINKQDSPDGKIHRNFESLCYTSRNSNCMFKTEIINQAQTSDIVQQKISSQVRMKNLRTLSKQEQAKKRRIKGLEVVPLRSFSKNEDAQVNYFQKNKFEVNFQPLLSISKPPPINTFDFCFNNRLPFLNASQSAREFDNTQRIRIFQDSYSKNINSNDQSDGICNNLNIFNKTQKTMKLVNIKSQDSYLQNQLQPGNQRLNYFETKKYINTLKSEMKIKYDNDNKNNYFDGSVKGKAILNADLHNL